MRFLLTKFGLINVDHIVEIRKSWAGLRIELINGETRDIKLPENVNVDALLEELSLQMIRSQIVDFESILEKFQDRCGHKNGSAVCGHKESTGPMTVDTTGAPASEDTDRIQDVDTGGAAKSVDTKEDIHRADGIRKKIVKICPICGGEVWWYADCLTEMDEPDLEQCTVYRELEKGFASKEKFAEVLGFGCWYCAYFSKVYCKTGETKEISWNEIGEKKIERKNLIWIEINERVRYAHDEESNVFILQHKKDGEFQTLKRFRYEDLKRIWDALPERATIEDIKKAAKIVGINVGSLGYYLMRIFTHVKFGGDITSQKTGGHPRMILIKNPDDCFFREEIRKQLELERDLIGEADSYGGV